MSNESKRQGRFAAGMRVRCEWCCAPLRCEYGTGPDEWVFVCPTCRALTLIFQARVTDTDAGWVWV